MLADLRCNGENQHPERDNTGANAYSYTGNRLNSVAGLTAPAYQYDANGNATLDGRNAMALTYNMLNLPATPSEPEVSVAYTYGALGNKLRKTSASGTVNYLNGIQYKYHLHFDEFNSLQEGSVSIVIQKENSPLA